MIRAVYCYRRNIKKCECIIYQLVFIPDEKEDIIVYTTRIDSSYWSGQKIAFNFSETQIRMSSYKQEDLYRLYNSSVPFFLNKCFVSVLQIYCRNDFASSLLSTTKQVRNSKQEMRSVG